MSYDIKIGLFESREVLPMYEKNPPPFYWRRVEGSSSVCLLPLFDAEQWHRVVIASGLRDSGFSGLTNRSQFRMDITEDVLESIHPI